MKANIAIIGGRGYVGETFLRLLLRHPSMELSCISSRSLAGRTIRSVYPDITLDTPVEYLAPTDVARRNTDIVVLALPNGVGRTYVDSLPSDQKILDVSADFRFNDSWSYGLPELTRRTVVNSNRVSNPGCYATAIELALAPLLDRIVSPPAAFGVSGYSGAGRTPTARNDPDRLKNNIQPYSLSGHLHEREVSHHLQQPICFMPHVAEFFRGLSITISATLNEQVSTSGLKELYESHYAKETLIHISEDVPEIRNVTSTPRALIGGFTVDSRDRRRISLVACIDNLMKGAASQAMQNINLMLGFDELAGVENICSSDSLT